MQASLSTTARNLAREVSPNTRTFPRQQSAEASGPQGSVLVRSITGVPSITRPGTVAGQVSVEPDPNLIQNLSALWVDPDACDTGFGSFGFRTRIEIRVDGQVVDSRAKCLGSDESFDFTTNLQQPGAHTIAVVAIGENSGNEFDRETMTVTVEEETTRRGDFTSEDEESGDGLFGGPILPCFLDPNRECGTLQLVGFVGGGTALLLLFLLAWL